MILEARTSWMAHEFHPASCIVLLWRVYCHITPCSLLFPAVESSSHLRRIKCLFVQDYHGLFWSCIGGQETMLFFIDLVTDIVHLMLQLFRITLHLSKVILSSMHSTVYSGVFSLFIIQSIFYLWIDNYPCLLCLNGDCHCIL